MSFPQSRSQDLPAMLPVQTLLRRTRAELAGAFDLARPIRVSRAPGRLDVMGGIADYTGSLVAELTLDRAAVVALQPRGDRELRIFSFNLLDEHQPFTFGISLDALVASPAETLRREFAQPGRQWAAYIAGCLYVLHERNWIDLRTSIVAGLNLAVFSTVTMGAGISSSAAIEVATMLNLIDHWNLRDPAQDKHFSNALEISEICQRVEHQIVGAPCGIMDQVSSAMGRKDSLLRMVCQPHELEQSLSLPPGICVVGLSSGVKHRNAEGAYGRTRCAAFMGHKIILDVMRQIGQSHGRELVGDPMRGYLANLGPEDYKSIFRPRIPETIRGSVFLEQFGPTIDTATTVDPATEYAVRHATDHHVLEAQRVRRFTQLIEQAHNLPDGEPRNKLLDRAGHLMYASHLSYTMDAMLGCDECDLLVSLVRQREKSGLYGAKITGGGGGGTIAILADDLPHTHQAIEQIAADYTKQTGHPTEIFRGSSDGAMYTGTALV